MPVSSQASSRAILIPLIAIILGTFMVILDNTVVNVALPTLGRVLNSDLSLLQWVITGYMLTQAAVIPLSGWLSDRFGAKHIYLVSLVLFTAGSALVRPRVERRDARRDPRSARRWRRQADAGMAVLYRLTPPDRRGAIFGLFGLPIMVAPAIGPLMSGYLLQYEDWRLIFLINLPVGVLALLIGLRVLPSIPAGRSAGALDALGVILGPLAFASLSFRREPIAIGRLERADDDTQYKLVLCLPSRVGQEGVAGGAQHETRRAREERAAYAYTSRRKQGQR